MGLFSQSENQKKQRNIRLTTELARAIKQGRSVDDAIKLIKKFEQPLTLESSHRSAYYLASNLTDAGVCWNLDKSELHKIFQAMLAAGFDVSKPLDREGNTFLHVAAEHRDMFFVENLFDAGADISALNDEAEMPVHIAIKNARWDMAKKLYPPGFAQLDPQSFSSAFKVLLRDYRAPDDLVLRFAMDALNKADFLEAAVTHGCTAFIQHYLVSGDAAAFKDGGFAIVMAALAKGDVHNLQMLLDKGFSCEGLDKNGPTPLLFAARSGNEPILRCLFTHEKETGLVMPRTGVLRAAIEGGEHKIIELLVRQGCTPDEILEDGGKPLLLYALEQGKTEAAIKLIAAGANVYLADHNGMTAHKFITEQTDRQLLDAIKWLQGDKAVQVDIPAKDYRLLDRHVLELRQGPLSTVFNFHTGQVITRDTEHGGLHVQDFDRLPRVQALAEAEKVLVQMKGELPEGYAQAASIKKVPTIPSKTR